MLASVALDIGGHHDPLCQLDLSSKLCKTLVLDEIYTQQPCGRGCKALLMNPIN